jgi:toxin ParE1/3/4
MAVEVRWTLYSLSDIENIAEYISKDSPFYARVQVQRFFDRAEILETHPNAGRVVPEIGKEEIRELIEGNYRLIYRVISDNRVDILTVYHSSRLFENNPFQG